MDISFKTSNLVMKEAVKKRFKGVIIFRLNILDDASKVVENLFNFELVNKNLSSIVSLSWENHLSFAQCDYASPSEVVSFYFRVICLALNVTVMAVVMLPQQEAII